MSPSTATFYRVLLARCSVVLMAFFLAATLVQAATPASTQASLVELDLAQLSAEHDLAAFMQVRDGEQPQAGSLEQVLAAPGWQRGAPAQDLLSAPREHSTIWLQAVISNTSSEPLTRWFDISPWRLNQVEAWFLEPQTLQVLATAKTGLDFSVAERNVKSSRALLPVTLAPGETQRLVLRITSDSRPFLVINSWDPVDYTAYTVTRYQTHAILLTVILTLLAVLLLQQSNRQYLLIGVWMLVAFIFESEKEGYVSFVLFSSLADYADNIRFSMWIINESLFLTVSVYLLGLSQHRIWRWLAPIALSVAAVFSYLTFILDGVEIRNLGSVINIILLVVWVLLIPSALKKKQRYQWFFLFLLSLWWLVTSFILLGYVFNFYYTSAFAPSRVIVEVVVMLGVLLAYSVQQRTDKQVLEYQLRTQEKAQRDRLQQAVKERTWSLRQAVEEASRANAAKTEFLARITHDLRSPLTPVLGYAQLLLAEKGHVGEMGRTIHGSAAHMLQLVNRLIDYARGAGEGEARLDDLYLFSFLGGIAKEANMAAQGNGNRFELITAPDLPHVVRSDATYLRQILLNLLDNAAKHTVDGNIELYVGCDEVSPDQRANLVFCITDNGCGVPPEQQERLWEAFYQPPGAREGQQSGLGLGLSIVQQLSQRLGGSLTFDSATDKGTRVCLSLPVMLGREEDIEAAILALPRHILPRLDGSGLTVWVVEDSPSILEFLSIELSGLGFCVHTFDDGRAVIEAISGDMLPPDIVLTDYYLPGANGDSVLAAVKRRCPEVPVLLLSATQEMSVSEGEPGGGGYAARLSKPVDLVTLRRELAKASQRELIAPESAQVMGASDLSNPAAVEVTLDADERQQLEHFIALGAVSDLMEWCQEQANNTPERRELAAILFSLAEQGRFGAIAEMIGSDSP